MASNAPTSSADSAEKSGTCNSTGLTMRAALLRDKEYSQRAHPSMCERVYAGFVKRFTAAAGHNGNLWARAAHDTAVAKDPGSGAALTPEEQASSRQPPDQYEAH